MVLLLVSSIESERGLMFGGLPGVLDVWWRHQERIAVVEGGEGETVTVRPAGWMLESLSSWPWADLVKLSNGRVQSLLPSGHGEGHASRTLRQGSTSLFPATSRIRCE